MKLALDQTKIDIIKRWLGTGSINVFGMPLAGKDTQCARLAKVLEAETFGGGDILRNSKTSTSLKKQIDNGMLAPTEEYKAIVLPYFNLLQFANVPLVLSSVGRWIGEESSVFEAAAASNHPLKAAVILQLDEEHARQRLHAADRGRADDQEHKLHVRFQEFADKTNPVLAVYDKQNLLLTVDGNQDVDTVTMSLIDVLYAKAQRELGQT